MTCEIVCVSYASDFDWCLLFLRSVAKYAKGFSGITIIVPAGDLGLFLQCEQSTTADGAPVRVKKYIDVPGKGMLMHEVMICSADLYCPKADMIMHMDSDCLFHEDVTPADYMVGGKPEVLMVAYDKFTPDRAEHRWQKNVMRALDLPKEKVPFETMQRHPAVHIREIYPSMRRHIETVHSCPFDQYVIEQENSWPQGFAEFPTLGAFAYSSFHSRYAFNEIGTPDIQPHPKSAHKVTQFWSHASRSNEHWALQQQQLRLARRILA